MNGLPSPNENRFIIESMHSPVYVAGIVYEAHDIEEFEPGCVGNFAKTKEFATVKPTFDITNNCRAFHISCILEGLDKEQIHFDTPANMLNAFHEKLSKSKQYNSSYYGSKNVLLNEDVLHSNYCGIFFKCSVCNQLGCEHVTDPNARFYCGPCATNMVFSCTHTSKVPSQIRLISSYQGRLISYIQGKSCKWMGDSYQFAPEQ